MKRQTFALLAALALSSSMVGVASGQAPKPEAPQAPQAPTNSVVRQPVRDQADLLAQRLGLNDEQKQKIKPILAEQSQKFSELRKVSNLKPEERRAKYTTIREDTNAKLKPILTPAQYEQLTRGFQLRTNLVAPPKAPAPAAPAPAVPAPAAPAPAAPVK